jgi:HlyD family secretion protein
MSATVDIETETVYDVVSVPIQAVTVRDFAALEIEDGGSEYWASGSTARRGGRNEDFRRVVFVVKDDVAHMREVKTGISDNRHMQIQGGLREGEEIVTGSYRVLSRELADGDPVEVRNQRRAMASN